MSNQGVGVTRRQMLGSAAVAGGALALAGPANAVASRAGPSSDTSAREFFEDETLNFMALFLAGNPAYGASEFGEALTAINRTRAGGSTYGAYYEAMRDLGQRVGTLAARLERNGRRTDARRAYLRSSLYLSHALFFTLGGPRPTMSQERLDYRRVRQQWNRAGRLHDPPFEIIRIPYGRTHLPGWFLRPPGRVRRRPTVILNNGSDGQAIEIWSYGAAAHLAAGYNVLLFEGPGQGAMLFERSTGFRFDWEKVVTPVVTYARRRDDVDRRRIALVGYSMGGYMVTRAAAFEHRLAAVVADPGLVELKVGWRSVPEELWRMAEARQDAELEEVYRDILRSADAETRFALLKRTEVFPQHRTFGAKLRAVLGFNAARVVPNIRTPFLVCSPEDEFFYPGEPERLYRALRSRKVLARFTRAEGANYHCEPMAPQRRNARVAEFLARRLG